MPPKSDKERAAAYRERKGEALREKERLRSKKRRQNRTEEEKKKHRMIAKLSARRKKSENSGGSASTTSAAPYKCKSTERKAIMKATRALPASPNNRKHIIEGLRSLFYSINCQESEVHGAERRGRPSVSEEITGKVQEFFCRDDISLCSPGMRDFVSVDGQKLQRRYLIMSVSDAYHLFVEEYGEGLLHLSKFAELRQKHVISFTKNPIFSCGCIKHINFIVCNALAQKMEFPKYSDSWIADNIICQPATEAKVSQKLKCQACVLRSNHHLILSRVMKFRTNCGINSLLYNQVYLRLLANAMNCSCHCCRISSSITSSSEIQQTVIEK